MNYKSWNDEELRRVLLTDPDDTAAICEAAERFAKQPLFELVEATCNSCGDEFKTWVNRDETPEDLS